MCQKYLPLVLTNSNTECHSGTDADSTGTLQRFGDQWKNKSSWPEESPIQREEEWSGNYSWAQLCSVSPVQEHSRDNGHTSAVQSFSLAADNSVFELMFLPLFQPTAAATAGNLKILSRYFLLLSKFREVTWHREDGRMFLSKPHFTIPPFDTFFPCSGCSCQLHT